MSIPRASSVLIADDTSDLRALVRDLLEATGRFEVVAEASDGAEAVELAARHRPDVVLLDLAMPVMDGLQALPAILTSSPASRVVALSGFEARRMAAAAVLAQGAVAYLDKDGLPDGLIRELLPLLDDLLPSVSRRAIAETVPAAESGRASDGPLNPRYLFETFVPGSSNRFAHAAALRWPRRPGSRTTHFSSTGPQAWEDPPPACHRPLHASELSGLAGALRLDRDVHERVHRRHSYRQLDPAQAALPRMRRVAGGRHPVPREQGADAGGVLPHLQLAARIGTPDRAHVGPAAEVDRDPRGPAAHPVRVGPHHRRATS